MEKRIIGERRDTVMLNTEHSTCFQLSTRERNSDINAFPLPSYTLVACHWMLSDVIKYLLSIKYKGGKSFHEI
jgi:hypothetical protein